MTASGAIPGPFRILTALYADQPMAEIFSENTTVDNWLRAELALSRAEAAVGIVDVGEVRELENVIADKKLDQQSLWSDSRTVGYPILPLVRQLTQLTGAGRSSRVHWGATTQDIMDTGLVLQLVAAGERLDALLSSFGDSVAVLVDGYRDAVMAARTHAQQAVPTTFGAKMAVYLGQITRDRARVRTARAAVATVSLYGAGGTSAALGPAASDVRYAMAQDLDLQVDNVPWHVARDRLAEFAAASASAAGTAARLGREIADLSRTEIGEVREVDGYHRGASSTMPQKRNPILSEAMIGFSVHAATLLPGVYRGLEAGHERAAGEWQAEWMVLPDLLCSTAGALKLAGDVVRELQADRGTMAANLSAEGGLVMAEVYMMRLAPQVGLERAHDIVYAAAIRARADNVSLYDVIKQSEEFVEFPGPLDPREYVGEAESICDHALQAWRNEREARTK